MTCHMFHSSYSKWTQREKPTSHRHQGPPPIGSSGNCRQAEQHIPQSRAVQIEGGQRSKPWRRTDVSRTAGTERPVVKTWTSHCANMWQPASERLQVGCVCVRNGFFLFGRKETIKLRSQLARPAAPWLQPGQTCYGFSYRCVVGTVYHLDAVSRWWHVRKHWGG